MPKRRKTIPAAVERAVLLESRRRCCLCFGLHRDEQVKNGQLAHLDRDPANCRKENLAYLCLDHHDQYDARTSQSKGLTLQEAEHYRDELVNHFGGWSLSGKTSNLLNFLTSQIGLGEMAKAATKVAGDVVWYGEELAAQVLTTDEIDYCDPDLFVPYLFCLDHFASWGWLTYSQEERLAADGERRVFIDAKREPVCDEVARHIAATRETRGAGAGAP